MRGQTWISKDFPGTGQRCSARIYNLQSIPKYPIARSIDDNSVQISVSVGNNQLYYDDNFLLDVSPGNYTLQLQAWADNDFDTGKLTEVTIEVEDPCMEI